MQCGREHHARTQNPEQRPVQLHSLPGRPPDDAQDDDGGQASCVDGVTCDPLEHAKCSLHEPPVLAVGAQPGEECLARACVGEVQKYDRRKEAERSGQALSSDQSRKSGGGGELGEGSDPQCHTGRDRSDPPLPGEPDPEGQCQQTERFEVTAPRNFDEEQGRPEPEQEDRHLVSSAVAHGPGEDPRGRKIASDPHSLHHEYARPRQRDQEEDELSSRWVDGGDGGIVDGFVIARSQLGELDRIGRICIRVYARGLDVPVPEVTVDVVGEFGGEQQKSETYHDGEAPGQLSWRRAGTTERDGGVARTLSNDKPGRSSVRSEGHAQEKKPRPRKAMCFGDPREGDQQTDLDQAQPEPETHHRRKAA